MSEMLQPSNDIAPQEKKGEPNCVHHWMIESPHGQISFGSCTNCHETKEFKNYLEDDWSGLTREQNNARVQIQRESKDILDDLIQK